MGELAKRTPTVRSALNRYKVEKGANIPFTHTTWEPAGKYFIHHEDDIETFMEAYCASVGAGYIETVTERPGAFGPLRIDIDLRGKPTDNKPKRLYKSQDVAAITKFYQEVIRDIVDDDEFEDKMLYCIVFEKAPRIEDDQIKDGFHLHFPFFICDPWTQDIYLRQKVTDRMRNENTWKGREHIVGDLTKLIDTNIAKKTWLMYGSSKGIYKNPFLFSYCLDEEQHPIGLDDVFEVEMVNKPNSTVWYLPRFLSIRGHSEMCKLDSEIIEERNSYQPTRAKVNIINTNRSREDIMKDIIMIKQAGLMEMLSDDRAEGYESWMSVGWTLFNIGQGCQEALDMWDDFSKRSPEKYM